MKNPLLLDGAMGTELIKRGVELPLPVWSADANLTHPDIIRDIHLDYIRSGADVITTNTFRTTTWTYRKVGFNPSRAKARARESLLKAVELARSTAGDVVKVAGSMTSVDDCYSPELFPGKSVVEDIYGETTEWFLEAGVDFVLFETMGNIQEIKIALNISHSNPVERWFSLILKDGEYLLDKSLLKDVVKIIRNFSVNCLLLNCNTIQTSLDGIDHLLEDWDGEWGAYPNLGVTDFKNDYFEIIDDHKFEENMRLILNKNPDVIGTCCGSSPTHVNALNGFIER